MNTGTFELYDSAFAELLGGTNGPLLRPPLAAVLLTDTYMPSKSDDQVWSDCLTFMVSDPDFRPQSVIDVRFDNTNESSSFTSSPIDFGSRVTITRARYLVLVKGQASALSGTDKLIGYMDLVPAGGFVSARNSAVTITPLATGWLSITRGDPS